jgi:hypothetical protein
MLDGFLNEVMNVVTCRACILGVCMQLVVAMLLGDGEMGSLYIYVGECYMRVV